MKSVLAKAQDGTITLTITIPKEAVSKAREEVIDLAVAEMELPGFRKGKAPKDMVEKKLDPLALQEDMLRHVLPKAYADAVLEHSLKPIINPKIHITKLPTAENTEDVTFTAQMCEMPETKLGDYKKAVKEITAKAKIAIPGKEQKEVSVDEMLQAIVKTASITVPAILVESEVDRLLSQMLDEVKTLGLTLDQYLASTHKTVEEVRKEYGERATYDIKVEFILQQIANDEKITVTPAEIDEAITKASTPQEKDNLEKNKYLLASILRQQKTFDFLKTL